MKPKAVVFSDRLMKKIKELEPQAKPLNIAIVGGGPGCKAVLKLFEGFTLKYFKSNIVGVAEIKEDAEGLCYARNRGIPTTKDFKDFYNIPDLDIIIELTGNNAVRDEIIRTKPSSVQVMDHLSARLFWDVIQIEEERLRIERQMAQDARLAAIGEIAAYIAHEIRNPLVAIAGFAKKLLKTHCPDDDCRRNASIIVSESERLEAVLSDIMSFVRPLEPHRQVSDINQVLADALALFKTELKRLKIKLKVRLDKGIHKFLFDPNLVKQSFINVIKNAMESMLNGGELEVKTQICWDSIMISFKDTGPGMPPEIASNIFNPFFTTKPGGMGLGLAMTKKIIEDHGGEITIASKPGQGTAFHISLPIEFK